MSIVTKLTIIFIYFARFQKVGLSDRSVKFINNNLKQHCYFKCILYTCVQLKMFMSNYWSVIKVKTSTICSFTIAAVRAICPSKTVRVSNSLGTFKSRLKTFLLRQIWTFKFPRWHPFWGHGVLCVVFQLLCIRLCLGLRLCNSSTH